MGRYRAQAGSQGPTQAVGVLEEAGGVGPSSSQRRGRGVLCAAFRDQQTASDVTTTIFTACIGYLVSYAAKSATEKISRNRHGLDADGNPISGAGVGEYTTTTTSDKEAKG